MIYRDMKITTISPALLEPSSTFLTFYAIEF